MLSVLQKIIGLKITGLTGKIIGLGWVIQNLWNFVTRILITISVTTLMKILARLNTSKIFTLASVTFVILTLEPMLPSLRCRPTFLTVLKISNMWLSSFIVLTQGEVCLQCLHLFLWIVRRLTW